MEKALTETKTPDGEVIIVRHNGGEKWSASYQGKHIVTGKCKTCVIGAVVRVARKSEKYNRVIVLDIKGFVEQTIDVVKG
jgi:hypothetical protein